MCIIKIHWILKWVEPQSGMPCHLIRQSPTVAYNDMMLWEDELKLLQAKKLEMKGWLVRFATLNRTPPHPEASCHVDPLRVFIFLGATARSHFNQRTPPHTLRRIVSSCLYVFYGIVHAHACIQIHHHCVMYFMCIFAISEKALKGKVRRAKKGVCIRQKKTKNVCVCEGGGIREQERTQRK